jgi:hypothetical protein
MAQLSSVIGSILRDIISAQHEANLYSISLNESYGKDGKTKDFQLPNVVLSDMELELRYAVVGADENQEQSNISYSRFRKFINDLCFDASKAVIAAVISAVLNTSIDREEAHKRFFYHLKRDDQIYKQFRSFLMRNMRKSFDNDLHESIETKTGKVEVDEVLERLMEVVRNKFLDDSDLDPLFQDADGKALKQEADDSARKALEDLIKKASAGVSFKRTKNFPVLDVAVTAEELEKCPPGSVHCFKLKFSPTSVDVSEPEDEEDLDNFVME